MQQYNSIEEFGAAVKTKYPAMSGKTDREIGEKMIEIYPQYKNQINGYKEPSINTEGSDTSFKDLPGNIIPSAVENVKAIGSALLHPRPDRIQL